MKEASFFLIGLVIFLFFAGFLSAIAGTITGKTITTKATQQVSINITVTNTNPLELTLITPKNKTYINNYSIPLTYQASNEESVWYNLDSGTNITITNSIHFNASEGSHTLFLYANNSNGEISRDVTFFVNSTKFYINNSEYTGTKKGGATDFSNYSYEELQNLSNCILENTDHGKIKFNDIINLTDDADFSNNEVNIDDYINISTNKIEINSTALPNFNKSATLSLYGLTFTTPRILRDGAVCPSTICTQESYSGGALKTLKFNVTFFSVYSSEETPVISSSPPTGGGTTGGGGNGGTSSGATIIPIKNFEIAPEEIKVKLKQGTFATEEILITNLESNTLTFELSVSKINDFVLLDESQFTLGPKESKVITINILAKEGTTPNFYIGEISIKSGRIEKRILTAVEIESATPLFDVKVTIPSRYNYVLPGEELISEIEIYNLGETEKEVDISVEYRILDWNGNIILQEQEDIAVNTKINYLKIFTIPEESLFGKYAVYSKMTYKDKVASGSAWFNVGKVPTIPVTWATVGLFIFAVIAIVLIVYKTRKIKKVSKTFKKVNEATLARAGLIKRRK